jgi:hypothetical protein
MLIKLLNPGNGIPAHVDSWRLLARQLAIRWTGTARNHHRSDQIRKVVQLVPATWNLLTTPLENVSTSRQWLEELQSACNRFSSL